MSGNVFVDGQREDKSRLHVPGQRGHFGEGKYTAVCQPWGLKLEKAMRYFGGGSGW